MATPVLTSPREKRIGTPTHVREKWDPSRCPSVLFCRIALMYSYCLLSSAVEHQSYILGVGGSIPSASIFVINRMKKKKLKEIIQGPLRFHHQDIHEELEELKGMIRDVSSQMQELQQRIEQLSKNTDLRMPQHDDNSGRQGFGLGPK